MKGVEAKPITPPPPVVDCVKMYCHTVASAGGSAASAISTSGMFPMACAQYLRLYE